MQPGMRDGKGLGIRVGQTPKTDLDRILHRLGEVQIEISNIDFRIIDGIPRQDDWDRLDALRAEMGELLEKRLQLVGKEDRDV